MSLLTQKERDFLLKAVQMAGSSRRPPSKLSNRIEPTWAALLANEEREIASEVFLPGDSEDAVKKILHRFSSFEASHESLTLYLTVEPRAGFERLPPVTESIRKLGIKRVILGAEDPSNRYRGEGRRTLEKMGLQVILADGEVARLCQIFLEDYAKVVQRGLPVIRARGVLSPAASGLQFQLSPKTKSASADAIFCGREDKASSQNSWRVLMGAKKELSEAERTIMYERLEKPVQDIGAVLRDLAAQGILSVELSGDSELFRMALKARLVDEIKADLPAQDDPNVSLAKVSRVRFVDQGEEIDLALSGVRLVETEDRCLEARVDLC